MIAYLVRASSSFWQAILINSVAISIFSLALLFPSSGSSPPRPSWDCAHLIVSLNIGDWLLWMVNGSAACIRMNMLFSTRLYCGTCFGNGTAILCRRREGSWVVGRETISYQIKAKSGVEYTWKSLDIWWDRTRSQRDWGLFRVRLWRSLIVSCDSVVFVHVAIVGIWWRVESSA